MQTGRVRHEALADYITEPSLHRELPSDTGWTWQILFLAYQSSYNILHTYMGRKQTKNWRMHRPSEYQNSKPRDLNRMARNNTNKKISMKHDGCFLYNHTKHWENVVHNATKMWNGHTFRCAGVTTEIYSGILASSNVSIQWTPAE